MEQSAAAAIYSGLEDTNRRYSCRSASQLTLFYGGKVNVYDNVPPDKAGLIMSVAAGSAAANMMNNIEESEDAPLTVWRTPGGQYLEEFQRVPSTGEGWAMACCGVEFGRIQAAASAIITHLQESSSSSILSSNSLCPSDAAPKVLPVHIARKLSLSRFLARRRNRLRSIGLQGFARDHGGRSPSDYNTKSCYMINQQLNELS